jgi:hypothetical protein
MITLKCRPITKKNSQQFYRDWRIELERQGYDVRVCTPPAPAKDWNELLISDSFPVQPKEATAKLGL